MHLFTFNIKSTKHNKDGATSAAVECYMLLHKYNQVISISLAQLNHIIYHIVFCIIIQYTCICGALYFLLVSRYVRTKKLFQGLHKAPGLFYHVVRFLLDLEAIHGEAPTQEKRQNQKVCSHILSQ